MKWIKKEKCINGNNYISYSNDNCCNVLYERSLITFSEYYAPPTTTGNDVSSLLNIKIKEILFSKNTNKCIINFLTHEMADQFFEKFLVLSPIYVDFYYEYHDYADVNSYSYREKELKLTYVKFNLLGQLESDLCELCKFLQENFIISSSIYNDLNTEILNIRSQSKKLNDLENEILNITRSQPRKLSDLEKEFYQDLLKLDQDNFSVLLEKAKKISKALNNANALWKLANSAEDLNPSLIDQCIECLACITPGLNYYFKSLEKLIDLSINKLHDPNISAIERRACLEKALSWAYNIPYEQPDSFEKITLSLLKIYFGDSCDEMNIFNRFNKSNNEDNKWVNYHVNLLMYVQSLLEKSQPIPTIDKKDKKALPKALPKALYKADTYGRVDIKSCKLQIC